MCFFYGSPLRIWLLRPSGVRQQAIGDETPPFVAIARPLFAETVELMRSPRSVRACGAAIIRRPLARSGA